MKTKTLVFVCSAAAVGLLAWMVGCKFDRGRQPKPAVQAGGAVHGSVVYSVPPGKSPSTRPGQMDKRTAVREIVLPDIEVRLRQATTGETLTQKTDLFGRYEFPVVQPGTYVLEWSAQRGWAAGNAGAPLVISGHTLYPLPLELAPQGGNRAITGVVKLADGGSPWFSDAVAGIHYTAEVKVQGTPGPAVRANFAGEFAHAEVPAGAHQLRAASRSSAGTKLVAAGVAPPDVEITLDNHRPRIDGILARQGGRVINAAPAGSIVEVSALVADADGDPVEITWRDAGGTVVGGGAVFAWQLPARGGVYTLHATISDRRGGDRQGRVSIAVGAKGVVVTGSVVGPNRTPVPGAKVTLNGAASATTDAQGFFKLKAALADRYILNIEKPGYAAFSRLFDRPVSGQIWELVAAQVQTFEGREAVTLVDRRPALEKKRQRGAVLRLPAGALVDASGNPATGLITAAFATLDIEANEAPGDYAAIDASATAVGLISYGMAFAEFTDSAGHRLNLRPGITADLSVPIPARMRAQAPDKIDLWFYDDTDGSWKPMGQAGLDAAAGVYVAQVTHFSTINMDQPGPVSCLRVHSDSSIPTGLILRVSDVPGGVDFAQVKEVVMDGPLNAVFRIPALTQVKLEVLDANHTLLTNIILEDGNTVGAIGTVLAGNIVASGPANPDLWPVSPYTDCKPVTLKLNAPWGGYPSSPFLTFRGAGSPSADAAADAASSDPTDAAAVAAAASAVDPAGVAAAAATAAAAANPADAAGAAAAAASADADAYYAFVSPVANARNTLEQWWATNGFSATGGDPGAAGYTYSRTSYLNNNDLGSGRDMHFLHRPGNTLAAYVTNYSRGGPFDQNPAYADDAAAQNLPGATVCMEFSPVEGQVDTTPIVKFFVYADLDGAAGTERQKAADLDGFGAKFVPNLCLNCHGGNRGTSVAGLSGANRSHFRELDLATYKFPGGATTASAAEQTAFRTQNLMITATGAARGPINDLINGWYPGGVGNQDNTYTPAQWGTAADPQHNLYHKVVKVSCRTCHIAFDSPDSSAGLDWNRYDQFHLRRSFIDFYAVGDDLSTPPSNRVMPHALVTYRNFWINRPDHAPEVLWLFDDPPEWTPPLVP